MVLTGIEDHRASGSELLNGNLRVARKEEDVPELVSHVDVKANWSDW